MRYWPGFSWEKQLQQKKGLEWWWQQLARCWFKSENPESLINVLNLLWIIFLSKFPALFLNAQSAHMNSDTRKYSFVHLKTFLGIVFIFTFSPLFAQQTLHGTVVDDSTQTSIFNSNVVISGHDIGTVTNQRGEFSLNIPFKLPVEIQVSHIGYVTKKVEVKKLKPITVRLHGTIIQIQDIEAIGKAPTYKQDLTTNVDLIENKDLFEQGARDMEGALRRVSGITMNTSSTGKQTVTIRGSNSSDVSVYLDGIRINDVRSGVADLSVVDGNSIQVIQVVKGGATSLYGEGALGGVVNIESKVPDGTSAEYYFGNGLTFHDDVDLTMAGSAKRKDFTVGGRFTGKSRAYAGQTITSNVYKHAYGSWNPSAGSLHSYFHQMDRSFIFPSGNIMSGDVLTVSGLTYNGDIGKWKGWHLLAGSKNWNLDEKYYSNIDQKIFDKSKIAKLGKNVNWNKLSGVVQIEYVDQDFSGDKISYTVYGNSTAHRRFDANRINTAFSSAIKWIATPQNSSIQNLSFEIGSRHDRYYTRKNEWYDLTDPTNPDLHPVYRLPKSWQIEYLSNLRLGMKIDGSLNNNTDYEAFFNQGRNEKLPSLNDYLLSVYQSNTVPTDSVSQLAMEKNGTLNVGASIHFRDPYELFLWNELNVSIELFRNNYDNKIKYELQNGNVLVPSNVPIADIHGIESSVSVLMFKRHWEIKVSSTNLKVSNPIVFPGRPENKYSITSQIFWNQFNVTFDYFHEGKQVFIYQNIGQVYTNPHEDANLTVSYSRKWRGLNFLLAYSVKNALSRNNQDLSWEETLHKGLNYFDRYREVVSIQVKFK